MHIFFKTCLFLYFKGVFTLKQYYIDALFECVCGGIYKIWSDVVKNNNKKLI